ncbi:hypothetical protein SCOCK_280056 [Actinacidiphila cocklensis]|uniref:Uncharacterized protein n=1 Tax=Actinacidiphila cocklensis TaxID=887465 RepID=A0A9W4DQX5_9ACTN|nr:hypothetical protein SCOCK_280056 [Actinacidiphila cocklensis]
MTTSSTAPKPACRSSCTDGIATLTMATSRMAMKAPAITTHRLIQLRLVPPACEDSSLITRTPLSGHSPAAGDFPRGSPESRLCGGAASRTFRSVRQATASRRLGPVGPASLMPMAVSGLSVSAAVPHPRSAERRCRAARRRAGKAQCGARRENVRTLQPGRPRRPQGGGLRTRSGLDAAGSQPGRRSQERPRRGHRVLRRPGGLRDQGRPGQHRRLGREHGRRGAPRARRVPRGAPGRTQLHALPHPRRPDRRGPGLPERSVRGGQLLLGRLRPGADPGPLGQVTARRLTAPAAGGQKRATRNAPQSTGY